MPGRSEGIEKAQAVVWATNPWASACETTAYPVGTLKKFYPALIQPHGRVHFVGAYADHLNRGQEAAERDQRIEWPSHVGLEPAVFVPRPFQGDHELAGRPPGIRH